MKTESRPLVISNESNIVITERRPIPVALPGNDQTQVWYDITDIVTGKVIEGPFATKAQANKALGELRKKIRDLGGITVPSAS